MSNNNVATLILAIAVCILGIGQTCTVHRVNHLKSDTDSLRTELLETQQRLWACEEWTNWQQQDIDTICQHIDLPLYDPIEMANQNCPECNAD